MITSKELRKKLEEVMDMIISNYTPAQWDAKKEIDVARYKVAKRTYKEAQDLIDLEGINWDDTSDEDYDAIAELMDKLYCEIEMMEEDLFIR